LYTGSVPDPVADADAVERRRFRYTTAMHEMGIAIEIYRTCREAVREHGEGRLHRVRIAVGELAAVEPDLLTFGWEAVIIDGPDEGAKLEIDFCKADQRCPQCNEAKDRSEGSWLRICPDCGTPLEVRGGQELDVLEVTFETDDDDPPP
jgi:hydrogenase nickel incorporation protein HypA/HybF